jgi:CspA family cold shock protein
MNEGKVKWYDETKGFGFIEAEGKKDVFVHRSGLQSPFGGLSEGQTVTFDIKQGDKGEVAFNVK